MFLLSKVYKVPVVELCACAGKNRAGLDLFRKFKFRPLGNTGMMIKATGAQV